MGWTRGRLTGWTHLVAGGTKDFYAFVFTRYTEEPDVQPGWLDIYPLPEGEDTGL